jgi:hypothetical protein
MDRSPRTRLAVSLVLIAFGLAATFAVADSLISNTPDAEKAQSSPLGEIEGGTDTPAVPAAPESDAPEGLAKAAPSDDEKKQRADAAWCADDQRCEREGRDGGRAEMAAVWAPVSAGDRSAPAPSCGDANSCVDRVVSLIPRVRERPLDLPTIEECTSSIGGDALCFDFGDGNYLVGDAPTDGAGELGFCTSLGYYYVAGPSPQGGAGGPCPDDRGDGAGDGGAPTVRDCTSSIGGEATCFDFGDGKYLVFDRTDEGEGELGFCAGSDYYFVSVAAPSAADGDAGAKCPDAAAARR